MGRRPSSGRVMRIDGTVRYSRERNTVIILLTTLHSLQSAFPFSGACLILTSVLLGGHSSEKGWYLPSVKRGKPGLEPWPHAAPSGLHKESGWSPRSQRSSPGREQDAPGAARAALAQGSTVVTLVSTTCSETLETEHWLCKDKDLCLAEERGLGAFRELQGPRPGRQREKAALNCSRNLPWSEDRRHSREETVAAGRVLGPRDTHAAQTKLPVRGREGRGELGWREPQSHLITAREENRGPNRFPRRKAVSI